ncbi:MAG: hypothetical protein H7Y17_12085, partial [Chlorobia bacterium]|nr:hypothetical protein [Fimbriimonadaceae bacterium]
MIALSLAIFASANSVPLAYLYPSLASAVKRAFFDDLPEFSDSPGPIETGANPTRDETYRNGLWDNELLPLLSNMETLESGSQNFPGASTDDPYGNMGQHEEPSMEELPPNAPSEYFAPSA